VLNDATKQTERAIDNTQSAMMIFLREEDERDILFRRKKCFSNCGMRDEKGYPSFVSKTTLTSL